MCPAESHGVSLILDHNSMKDAPPPIPFQQFGGNVPGSTTFRTVSLFAFVHFTFDPTTLRAPGVITGSILLFIPLCYLEYDECYYGPHV